MPRVRLNFPNVLNTSVQVGDYAYFSNPRAVGPVREYPGETGLPSSGGTHTPHMTNDQSEIIMIGEILEVGEWLYEDDLSIRSHDTFAGRPPVPNAGFIICDMPQDLFNQYWDEIANGKCEQVMVQGPGTDECGDFAAAGGVFLTDYPRIVTSGPYGFQLAAQTQGYSYAFEAPLWHFYPGNKNVPINEAAYHVVMQDPYNQATVPSTYPSNWPYCSPLPGEKNVIADYDAIVSLAAGTKQTGDDYINQFNPYTVGSPLSSTQPYTATGAVLNVWRKFRRIRINYYYQNATQSQIDFVNDWNANAPDTHTANDLLVELSSQAPQYYNTSMDHTYLWYNYQNHQGPLTGNPFLLTQQTSVNMGGTSGITFEDDCVDPSYIMFSKDNKANMSSLVGYYASVELRNNSLDKAELFNVGSVFTESSK